MTIISRRDLIVLISFGSAYAFGNSASRSQNVAQSFADQLGEISEDPAFAASSSQFKEEGFRQRGPSLDDLRGNANLPRRWVSDKKISERAVSLIIAFEVTSRAVYTRSYSRPTWPQGFSGVTVGIGYDLGYARSDEISLDWLGIVGDAKTNRLQGAQGITGFPAKIAAEQLRDVEIGWDDAMANFVQVLRYYAGETIRYFPNSDQLSADSFGALVSLVYNRGSATESAPGDSLDRRREMREIKRFCLAHQFDLIPEQIRRMERLWQNDKAAAGLIKRREIEALLFQSGLSQ